MEDDLLLPSSKITQLPEDMTAVSRGPGDSLRLPVRPISARPQCATANSCNVLPNGVIVGNYLSVAPSSANVWMKQFHT